MRTARRWLYTSIFSLGFYAVSWGQVSRQPAEVTLCDLYQHPDQYAGKMVKVRGSVAGNDMWIDAFTEKPCSSWMPVVVVFPTQVKPTPSFDLSEDSSFKMFEDAMYHSRPIHIDATFEGRFDSVIKIQDGQRIRIGKSYGKKYQYDGRIVLQSVSDVVAQPLPRK
jgi:hypothetical protein